MNEELIRIAASAGERLAQYRANDTMSASAAAVLTTIAAALRDQSAAFDRAMASDVPPVMGATTMDEWRSDVRKTARRDAESAVHAELAAALQWSAPYEEMIDRVRVLVEADDDRDEYDPRDGDDRDESDEYDPRDDEMVITPLRAALDVDEPIGWDLVLDAVRVHREHFQTPHEDVEAKVRQEAERRRRELCDALGQVNAGMEWNWLLDRVRALVRPVRVGLAPVDVEGAVERHIERGDLNPAETTSNTEYRRVPAVGGERMPGYDRVVVDEFTVDDGRDERGDTVVERDVDRNATED